MKLSFVLLCVLLLTGGFAAAQSNDTLDGFLASEHVSYGSTAALVLAAAEIIAPDTPDDQAIAALERNGIALSGRSAGDALRLDEYCFLLMSAFELRGGIMYSLVPGPRYAYRELVFRKLIPRKSRPDQGVSGERALAVLGRVIALKEKS